VLYLGLLVFDMTEEKSIVMAKGKTSLQRMIICLSLLLRKVEWYKLSSLGTCHEFFFLWGQRMLKYLTVNPLDTKDPTYKDWMGEDSIVM
jgi:hypothetical protein